MAMKAGQPGHPRGLVGRILGQIMASLNADMELEAIARLDLRADAHVLEIGFGPGVGIAALAQRLTDGQVAGVDVSAVMVEQARRRAARAARPCPVDLRQASVEHLPWPGASFDAAFSVNCAQFWPDAHAGLQEVMRVVRPGGRIVIALRASHEALVERLESVLRESGRATSVDRRKVRTGEAIFLTFAPGAGPSTTP